MSPRRVKGRGGGGAKTMAPLPVQLPQPSPPPIPEPNKCHQPLPAKKSACSVRGAPLKPETDKLKAASRTSVLSKSRFSGVNTHKSSGGVRKISSEIENAEPFEARGDDPGLSYRCKNLAKGSGKDPLKDFFRRNFQKELCANSSKQCATSLPLPSMKGPDLHNVQQAFEARSETSPERKDACKRQSTISFSVSNGSKHTEDSSYMSKISGKSDIANLVNNQCCWSVEQVDLIECQMKDGTSQNPSLLGGTKHHASSPENLSLPVGAVVDGFSTTLRKRLSLLEGRVCQIAAELQKTKEMLAVNESSSSQALLSEIEGKLFSIEKTVASTFDRNELDAEWHTQDLSEKYTVEDKEMTRKNHAFDRTSSLVSENATNHILDNCKDKILDCATISPYSMEENGKSVSNKENHADGQASCYSKRVKPTLNQQDLEERLFPHRKLLRDRPSLHQAIVETTALHSQITENMSHFQMGAFQSCTQTVDKQDLITSEFLTQLKQRQCVEEKCSSLLSISTNSRFEDSKIDLFSKSVASQNTGMREESASGMKILSTAAELSNGHKQICHKEIVSVTDTTDTTQLMSQQIQSSKMASNLPGKVQSAGSVTSGDAAAHLECDESPLSEDLIEDQEGTATADVLGSPTNSDMEDYIGVRLNYIGDKVATAGWFVSDGNGILLAHDDGYCSYYDAANMEVKAVYKGASGMGPAMWNDCWLIRAPGSDGCSNKYVVAASAGNALDSGFCSWDFYSKEVVAYHCEDETVSHTPSASVRSCPGYQLPCRNKSFYSCSSLLDSEGFNKFTDSTAGFDTDIRNEIAAPLWWYTPCGSLLASASTSQKTVTLYDIRDGDVIITWDIGKMLTSMDFSSPLQWRNKGTIIVFEEEAISAWDVMTIDAQCLRYIKVPGKQVVACQINNADVESSGGVRRRYSSSENEAHDGIFCTMDDVNVLDFRVPTGIGLRIPSFGVRIQSVFAHGDMILTGGVRLKNLPRPSSLCGVHQWSLRKAMPVCTYRFPASSAHCMHLSVCQVWGSSSVIMGINGNGLFIFDQSVGQEDPSSRSIDSKEVIGPDDIYNPTFDYATSQVLLISRDRPASWRYWP